MEETKRCVELDDDANKLYQMLGGLDTDYEERIRESDGFIESLAKEEKEHRRWLTTLNELTRHLASFLRTAPVDKTPDTYQDGINAVIEQLAQLAQMPGHGGKVLIRFRGWLGTRGTTSALEYDYTVESGNILLDIAAAKKISGQTDNANSQLQSQLTQSFIDLAALNIQSICLKIGNWSLADSTAAKKSLQALGLYYNTIAQDASSKDNETLIYNEHNQIDPNLTTVAQLNKLKPEALQKLVRQINDMMLDEKTGASLQHCPCVYDAIFAFKKFREQLQRPTIEVNNIRWLLAKRENEKIPTEKILLSQALADIYNNSPTKVASTIEDIYGCDYRDIEADRLSQILEKVSDVIDQLEQKNHDIKHKKEIILQIQRGLDQVSGRVLNALRHKGDKAVANSQSMQGGHLLAKIHKEILQMISFFIMRSSVNAKLHTLICQENNFNEQDLLIIAKDFGINHQEADELIALLRECFSSSGKFHRRNFESNIPRLIKSEKKVFGVLWHYLKVIKHRDDRVAFLNSLQLFIAKMTKPHNALHTLLLDFSSTPEEISYSDRNALILANILIRKYNKELHNHIEHTPEEVLLVQEGLNTAMTKSASLYIDSDSERFIKKTKHLHTKMTDALSNRKDGTPMAFHYVASVERELFILLSLLEGSTGHKIIKSAVKEYGQPHSAVYESIQDSERMKLVFGLLQIGIRGLARFKDSQDIELLQEVKNNKTDFTTIAPAYLTQVMVNRTMDFADQTIKQITQLTS